MVNDYKQIYRTHNSIISVKDVSINGEPKDDAKMFKYTLMPDIPSIKSEVYITDSEIALMYGAIPKRRKFWLKLSMKFLLQWYRRDYGGQNE